MPEYRILNFSTPGNTYGFNNLDTKNLNTLKNIDIYLDHALDSVGGRKIDYLFMFLGNNDCKRKYDNELPAVPDHLRELIRKINAFPGFKNRPPHIVVITPILFGPDSLLPSGYLGADERVKYLIPYFKDITHQSRCGFIDVYNNLDSTCISISSGTIHLTGEGHDIICKEVMEYLDQNP